LACSQGAQVHFDFMVEDEVGSTETVVQAALMHCREILPSA
jgi:hypothetical protein